MVVFPGGDYDVYRPTLSENLIDFDGRTGYVRAAINAGVPIVPAVAIGGQESQLYLSRGMGLAKALRLDKLMRVKILPISVGFPFGLSAVLPVNVPLPTKIVMQVLEPIDVIGPVRRAARHRRGRRPCPTRHAKGARRAGQRTSPPGHRLAAQMAPLGLLGTMVRAGIIAPLRPDKYLRIAAVARREGLSVTSGFGMSAQRCPNRPALVDELGTLTYRQLDQRADALAAALQALPGGTPEVLAIMCRNHRGFVESLIAANRIGADVLLLNTSFAGPALADVVNREGADAVIYDEEFTDSVDRALTDKPDTTRVVGWTDHPENTTPPSRSWSPPTSGSDPSTPAARAG